MEIVNLDILAAEEFQNVGTVSTLINNLNKLTRVMGAGLNDVSIFYRGHADSDWAMIPGVYRDARNVNKEDFLTNSLMRNCPDDFKNCSSSFERLVKMQHYALPTRLLDISSNPLVGLYFAACEEFSKDGELIIYFVKNSDLHNYRDAIVNPLSMLSFLPNNVANVGNDRGKFKTLISNFMNFNEPMPFLTDAAGLDEVLCVLPKLDNPRIIRQQGAFFLFGIANGNKANISSLNASTLKFKIIASQKKTILKQLDIFGINEKHCFPEIDKVAHYLKNNI